MNIVIVYLGGYSENIEKYLRKLTVKANTLGYVTIQESRLPGINLLGPLDNLGNILRENIVDEVVIIVSKGYKDEFLDKYVSICEESGITVKILMDVYNMGIFKLKCENRYGNPVLIYHYIPVNHIQLLIKRIIDIIGSILGLIFTGFISLFLIPAVKIDSPGPVFFKQKRVGLNGRNFILYKFRSMTVDAEYRKKELMQKNEILGDYMFKIKDDPRVTGLGKILRRTSLDEFPQFFNVLKGEMSLVGTRPPTTEEFSRYENIHRRRLRIKPGITGLWQISGRSDLNDFSEVIKLDNRYISEWSIWLDLKIIAKTIIVLLCKKGAY